MKECRPQSKIGIRVTLGFLLPRASLTSLSNSWGEWSIAQNMMLVELEVISPLSTIKHFSNIDLINAFVSMPSVFPASRNLANILSALSWHM